MPSKSTTAFNLLRSFHGGADGNVVLVVSESGSLCVLKLHFNDADRETELTRWESFYSKPCFVVPVQNKRQALVMPLVFHVTVDKNGGRNINFNLVEWTKEPMVDATTCPALDKWTTQLSRKWMDSGYSIEKVAVDAVKKFANTSFAHDDLKWQHVGVLPIVENGMVVRLDPVLIDLVRVKQFPTAEGAKAYMFETLKTMGIPQELLD